SRGNCVVSCPSVGKGVSVWVVTLLSAYRALLQSFHDQVNLAPSSVRARRRRLIADHVEVLQILSNIEEHCINIFGLFHLVSRAASALAQLIEDLFQIPGAGGLSRCDRVQGGAKFFRSSGRRVGCQY